MDNTNVQNEAGKGQRSGPIAWMTQNPIAANLLMVLLLAGGIWTAFSIQKEVFPQFQLDIVEVDVRYPGAAPEEVEHGILLPVEEAVQGVQGIKEMTSRAREGSGRVTLELVAGTNRMKALQDIDQAVNSIRTFPENAEEPEVQLESRQRPVMQIGLYGDVDIWTLRKLAERVRDRFLNQNAITQVGLDYVPEYVTHVEIPKAKLRKHELTLEEIARIIEQSSRDIPAGSVETSHGEILLRMKERKQRAKAFASIVVVPSDNGAPLRLADLADVTDGFEETGFHSQYNGHPSVEIGVYRIGKQSPLEIAAAVENVLDDIEKTLPSAVQTRIDSSRAEDYHERLSLLQTNAAIALGIVLLILTVFLEYRLAFWVMMGMTISFVGGIALMPILGVSINMISMFAFLLVLGIVVDDAIVVGENIYEYRRQNLDFVTVAIQGARDISRPVIFSIITNVVAFLPLMFVPGTMGKFWWPLPAVVITILLVSLLEALLILPAHLGHTAKGASTRAGECIRRWQQAFAERFNNFVNKYYAAFLDLCLRYRYITLSAAIALLVVVGAYGRSAHMGMIMMPEVSADEIEAGVSLPVGTTTDQAAEMARKITRSTRSVFHEHHLYRAAEGIKTNIRGQSFIDVEVVMKPPDQRDMTASDVIETWRKGIADIKGVDQITFEAERGPGGWRDDISVDLTHSSIDVLEEASQFFSKKVAKLKATQNINDNYNKGKTRMDFTLLPKGRNLGLTPSEVGQQVRNAFYGAIARRQLRGTNEVEVRVKLPESQRESMHHLENLVIQTPDGTDVPLMEVARVKRDEAFTSIQRRAGRRVISVGMDVEPKRATTRVLKRIEGEILPEIRAEFPGLTWTFEGAQAEMRESTKVLTGGFALAMVMIYALLAVAFGSYFQPLIVMTAIPFGIVGAVIGHILLGYDLSLISIMGLVGLSGILVNDALIMIDYANRKRGEHTALEAIHQAGIRRFRPITLTTLTTFGGLTPIIFETSRQAAYLIPMAISLGFGILFATAIILVIVPSLYMIFEDLYQKIAGRESEPAPETESS